ncbi:hypothetical protein MMC16_000986 [Acarospora aff. strigata]|nr:hypothetical protein [Acarospora aff. strigata]
MNEDVNTVSPTLGFIIKTIDYDGSYWRNYFEKTDALIWVVDATDRLRIEDCREELAGLLLEERLMGASLLVFSNKVDVAGCMSNEEIREVQAQDFSYRSGDIRTANGDLIQGLQLNAIKTHKWTIIRCSAITGENLKEGLEWVVQDARDRLFLY